MDALQAAFQEEDLDEVPRGLLKALEVEEVGAAGWRRVYGRLYWIVKTCGLLGSKRWVVWTREVREAVRETVAPEPDERPAGSYDDQYEDKPEVLYVTMRQLAKVDWDKRPVETQDQTQPKGADNRPVGGGKIKTKKPKRK